jgi:hypothetical protein
MGALGGAACVLVTSHHREHDGEGQNESEGKSELLHTHRMRGGAEGYTAAVSVMADVGRGSVDHNAGQLPSRPMALEAIARTVTSEMRLSHIINNLAREVRGMASVGPKDVAVQKAKNR